MLKFPPWNAEVWMHCAGAASLQKSHPLPTVDKGIADSRAEGKAFDWVVTQILKEKSSPKIGDMTPNNIQIDDEMMESANDYVAIVKAIPGDLYVEQPLALDFLSGGQTGRPDILIIDKPGLTVTIIDAKYGHTYVDEFECYQNLISALGAHNLLELDGIEEQYWTFDMKIFQPRVYGSEGSLRSWALDGYGLRPYRNHVDRAIGESHKETPVFTTGNHCTKCDGRHACSTYARDLYRGLGYVGNAVAMDLHGEALGVEYKLLKHFQSVLKGRMSGIEQQVMAELQNGKAVPGAELKNGKGRERWKRETPVDEVIMMGDLMGVELRKEQQLCTPSQAKKKGVDLEVISEYSETPPTGLKLVEVTEKSTRKTFYNTGSK